MSPIKFGGLFVWAAVFGMLAPAVWAVCTNPAGNEGEIVYNSTYKLPQFCNGTDWVAWGSGGAAASSYFTTVTAIVRADVTGTSSAWSSKVFATCPTGYSLVHWSLTYNYAETASGTYHYCDTGKENSTTAYVQITDNLNNVNFLCGVTALCVKD
jgi:hypothetical protein